MVEGELTGWQRFTCTSRKDKWNMQQSTATMIVVVRTAPVVMKRRYDRRRESLKPRMEVM